MAWQRIVFLAEFDDGVEITDAEVRKWLDPLPLSIRAPLKGIVLLSNKPLEATEPDPTPSDVIKRIQKDVLE